LKQDFMQFLEEDLLPKCKKIADENRRRNKRCIIVMDNCRIHHGQVHPNP